MRTPLTALLLVFFLLASCAAPTNIAPPTIEVTVTSQAVVSSTPFSAPTPETTPTPEAGEMDLHPSYEQNVVIGYMGVKINSSLITDESLDPVIRKVTISNESAYAEFIARSIYKVWHKKGGVNGTGPETETSFEDFMKLWATAQTTGSDEDWRKVQVANIWVNDIATKGYDQDPYTIWFMHEGQTPEGVKGISKMSVALVNGKKVENIILGESGSGAGVNIIEHSLYVYRGILLSDPKGSTLGGMADTANWLLANSDTKTYNGNRNLDRTMYNLLQDIILVK